MCCFFPYIVFAADVLRSGLSVLQIRHIRYTKKTAFILSHLPVPVSCHLQATIVKFHSNTYL